MITHNLGLAAAFALVANSFIIPSTISVPELMGDGIPSIKGDHGLKALEMSNLRTAGPEGRLVKLNCPECSSLLGDGGVAASSPEEISLILDFNTSEDDKHLLLNGVPFYNSGTHRNLPGPFVAPLSIRQTTTEPRALSWSSACTATEAADGVEARIVDIIFLVDSLDGEHISVDNVAIRLLENSQKNGGAITFIDISTRPSQHKPSNDTPTTSPTDVCTGNGPSATMCKWRAALLAKLSSMRDSLNKPGCLGLSGELGLGPHSRPTNPGAIKIMKPHRKGPHPPHGRLGEHHHPHGGPHHHRHHHDHHHLMHRIGRALHHFMMGFVVPVLIGVAAGMAASVLGMVIGTGIATAWIKLVRGGKRGKCAAAMLEEESLAENNEEKKGLLVEDVEVAEAPPVYVQKE